MASDLQAVLAQFNLQKPPVTYGDGHINDTYLVENRAPRYILQRINRHVFAHPEEVMANIALVTDHLRKKILSAGGDPARETLTIVPTKDGRTYYRSPEGEYYRVYVFIEGAHTDSVVEKPEHFYNAARAFGHFQKLLADFPASRLTEVIPRFHDTRKRLDNLRAAIAADPKGRKAQVEPEIAFALARAEQTGLIVDALADKRLPLRVTHNDTKYNNVMLDDVTGEAICVIDLDTVMPGSLLYDYGDSLRFGTNPAPEDEKDLSKVYCSLPLFEAFTRGYLRELGDTITPLEREWLPLAGRMMTLECGMRFLTDYLEGDTYFRIHYPEQNLDRTRTQFKLVADMEQKEPQMKAYIASL